MQMNIKHIQRTETFKLNLLNAVVILMKHVILHLLHTDNKVIQEIVEFQTEFTLVIMVRNIVKVLLTDSINIIELKILVCFEENHKRKYIKAPNQVIWSFKKGFSDFKVRLAHY